MLVVRSSKLEYIARRPCPRSTKLGDAEMVYESVVSLPEKGKKSKERKRLSS